MTFAFTWFLSGLIKAPTSANCRSAGSRCLTKWKRCPCARTSELSSATNLTIHQKKTYLRALPQTPQRTHPFCQQLYFWTRVRDTTYTFHFIISTFYFSNKTKSLCPLLPHLRFASSFPVTKPSSITKKGLASGRDRAGTARAYA
ncbi:hypothetical protein B0H10DRAFT_976652 [Mycena sp. CBHHK59/15]|nr:hypothetical protein B0H10DRAFT_976652 [Mycena sp. CBHHK59/15]